MPPDRRPRASSGMRFSRACDAATLFRKDCSGAVALLFGLTLIPIVMIAGVAIDYTSAHHVRTKLQNALDSATFAVMREVGAGTDSGTARQAGMDILTANLGSQFSSDFAVNFTIDGSRISGAASLNVPTYLLGIIGKDHFEVGATTVVNASR